jgi:hypothetical protein
MTMDRDLTSQRSSLVQPEFANFISQALDVHNMTKEKRKIPDNPHRR